MKRQIDLMRCSQCAVSRIIGDHCRLKWMYVTAAYLVARLAVAGAITGVVANEARNCVLTVDAPSWRIHTSTDFEAAPEKIRLVFLL